MNDKSSTLTVKTDQSISLPVSKEERRIAIRYQDWDRCKRKLKRHRQQTPRLHLIYSFLFGITASSGFSLVTSLTDPETQLPTWGYSFYGLLLLFCLVTGIIFIYLDRKLRLDRSSAIDEILDDMESIERAFA